MLNDDVGLWSFTRAKASNSSHDVVALVGSSRIQLGIDTQVFAQKTGITPIQLAIDGHPGLRILRHLADDRSFRGIVICEFMEKYAEVIERRQTELIPEEWVKKYEARSIFSEFEWRARMFGQQTFAFRLPELSLRNLANALRLRQYPMPPYIRTQPDRSKQADFTLGDIEKRRKNHASIIEEEFRTSPSLSVPEYLKASTDLNDMVDQISARGGRVIFVRFPTSGKILEMEEARYPKRQYWDALAKEIKAPMIHFKEHSELIGFECADGTHLDYKQAALFTEALAEILAREGIVSSCCQSVSHSKAPR
ncbi:MAG: hypothetical protein JST84_24135 [Acidobacteria bacterium]|nr:hypothetical protein [Acidobacteriota bacterium]